MTEGQCHCGGHAGAPLRALHRSPVPTAHPGPSRLLGPSAETRLFRRLTPAASTKVPITVMPVFNPLRVPDKLNHQKEGVSSSPGAPRRRPGGAVSGLRVDILWAGRVTRPRGHNAAAPQACLCSLLHFLSYYFQLIDSRRYFVSVSVHSVAVVGQPRASQRPRLGPALPRGRRRRAGKTPPPVRSPEGPGGQRSPRPTRVSKGPFTRLGNVFKATPRPTGV